MNQNNKIFGYFDNVYCINLEKRIDRKVSVIEQFNSININNINFVNAIEPKNQGVYKTIGAHGCALSHLKIYELEKNKNSNNFIVFEDDVIFENNFNEKIKPIIENLKDVEWDIFYFFYPTKGLNDYNGNRGDIIKVYPSGLVKNYGSIFTHAYAVNKKCLNELKLKVSPEYIQKNNHIDIRSIDKAISNLNLNFFACNTNLTFQDPNSYSSISNN
jgi:hypothetical protein